VSRFLLLDIGYSSTKTQLRVVVEGLPLQQGGNCSNKSSIFLEGDSATTFLDGIKSYQFDESLEDRVD